MKIGLAYAMPGELEHLLPQATHLETVCGVSVYQLGENIYAYVGGIGKVNAAMSAQLFINRYQPDCIINAGVAGSLKDLPVGTIVLAEDFVQHDVDTSPMGDPVGLVSTVNCLSFPTAKLTLAKSLLDEMGVSYQVGRVATGEVFMTRGKRADWVLETFAATLCEMEGGAIAQVCLRNNIAFMALKSVSDRICGENNAEEYFNYPEAMAKLNDIVLPFARLLRDSKEA